jgi:hypothetical protein
MARTHQITGPKRPLSQSEIDKKISEIAEGEIGDDIHAEKYAKKKKPEKRHDGPNFDKYSDQEDGDTSVNAGVYK